MYVLLIRAVNWDLRVHLKRLVRLARAQKVKNIIYWIRESTGTRESMGGESMGPEKWTLSSSSTYT